ncbi:MAG: hypothetical protein U0270_41920 [Labilithrix sp.]
MRRIMASLLGICAGCSLLTDLDGLAGSPTGSGVTTPEAGALPIIEGGTRPAGDGAANEAGAPGFLDLFDRPDGVVGNGWLETIDGVFVLRSGRAVPFPGRWTKRILYRPSSEDLLDVESSVEVVWDSVPPKDSDAALSVRVATTGAELTGYSVFVDNVDSLVLTRVVRSAETELARGALRPGVVKDETYRFRLRAQGTSPVQLEATFERRSGDDWEKLVSLRETDEGDGRLTSPGSVALTSDVNASYGYDTFTRSAIP